MNITKLNSLDLGNFVFLSPLHRKLDWSQFVCIILDFCSLKKIMFFPESLKITTNHADEKLQKW